MYHKHIYVVLPLLIVSDTAVSSPKTTPAPIYPRQANELTPGAELTLLLDSSSSPEREIIVKDIHEGTKIYEITENVEPGVATYTTVTYIPSKTLILSEKGSAEDNADRDDYHRRTRAPTGTWTNKIGCPLDSDDPCLKTYGTPTGISGYEGGTLMEMAGSSTTW